MIPWSSRCVVAALVASIAIAGVVEAQTPLLTVNPAQPAPGSIVRLTLNGIFEADSLAVIEGEMAGEPLHFRRGPESAWRSLGGIPVDAVGEVTALAFVNRTLGTIDTVRVSVTLPRPKPSKGRPSALAVSPRFTRPLDSATQARIDSENERARSIGRRAHDSPPMWSKPFLRPRASTVTSRFGTGRMFNGTVTSRHLGVDFRGAAGQPIRAANRGVVALVDEFFLAGNVVYIDHGGGLVTGYFHMSKALVAAGDTVSRGQEIGLVGATGRVTAAHLHWTARYGAITVNPLDLVAIPAGWYRIAGFEPASTAAAQPAHCNQAARESGSRCSPARRCSVAGLRGREMVARPACCALHRCRVGPRVLRRPVPADACAPANMAFRAA